MAAVKIVRAELAGDPEFRRRFRNEVRAARRVGGQWTAPVLDADTESRMPWVATGYVSGPTLTETVERLHGPLPNDSVLVLAAGLARALQAVHRCGLIHRDLKPSNVLVTIDGPRVIDFGIARAADASAMTRTGMLIGSPGFMSPEQARGERVTPASDIFCLGSVLVYAATGRQPFGAGEQQFHAQLLHISQGSPDLGRMTGPARELAARCLAKDPAERPSLDQILAAVDAATPPGPKAPWLPGELVAQLGRHAVELLELEDPQTSTHMSPPGGPPTAQEVPTRRNDSSRSRRTPPALLSPSSPSGRRNVRTYAIPTLAVTGIAVLVAGLIHWWPDGGQGNADGSGKKHSGGSSPSKALPAAYLGSWELQPDGSKSPLARRMTFSRGSVGDQVLTIRAVGNNLLCEGTGTLESTGSSADPTVLVRVHAIRSFGDGQCLDSRYSLSLNSGRIVKTNIGIPSSTVTATPDSESVETYVRSNTNQLPEAYVGTWDGPGTDSNGSVDWKLTIKAGSPGDEIVQSTYSDSGGTCEGSAILVSLQNPIVLFQTTGVDKSCPTKGKQTLALQDDGSLSWKSPSSDIKSWTFKRT
jgi:serine/threonine protein kinase